MKAKLIQNLSANTLQLVCNQLLGLVIFYILSATLNKNDFGQINLALAILLGVFNILSLGIDQLIIKRVAAGVPAKNMLSLYLNHVLLAGCVFYGLLLIGWFALPLTNVYNMVLLIGIGKLLLFFSTPFKQIVSGMERFKPLARMLVVSNIVRCICLLVLLSLYMVSVQYIIVIFIGGDTLELLLSVYLFKKNTAIIPVFKWDKAAYLSLLRDAAPQSGVVIITAALARLDWIFVGTLLSTVKLAEYSFAYKAFEMSTLPLLAIAPLLIPRFTKLVKQGNLQEANIGFLLRVEFIVAALIGLVLNVCWAPVIDMLTAGKYGAVNSTTVLILSLCMPLLYLQNILWTIYFAQGQLKMILHSFIVTLIVNVTADVVLIPIYKNEGAAAGFLLSCVAQVVFFLSKNKIDDLKDSWHPLVICTAAALAGGFAAKIAFNNSWATLPLGILFYFILLIITGQCRFSDRENLKAILN